MAEKWWLENNMRLIQTNLRMSDATKDIKSLVDFYEEMNANTVLINTAGICSFYPSKYDVEKDNPYLNGRDFIGQLIHSCHERGIRVISRFDFSKIDESIYLRNPEWAYQDKNGETINYNGLIHTCINGKYQKELSLALIEEVLQRYPVDGVFFNMFGYVTRDYSNVYHGICHCESCKRDFKKFSGFDLPDAEDTANPIYQKYIEFKEITVNERLRSIYEKVKSYGENIAVCNYARNYVDVVMSESNTELHRPYPIWEYMTSDNISRVYGSYCDKVAGDININASSIDFRFNGISTPFSKHRFYQSLLSDGQLAWCIIGTPDDYPDRKNFASVRDIYLMHKNNEEYFGKRRSIAEVLLVIPTSNNKFALDEYNGIFRALKENHILFKTTYEECINTESLDGIHLVILPGIKLDEKLYSLFSASGIKILVTGTEWYDEKDIESISRYLGKDILPVKPFDSKHCYMLINKEKDYLSDWAFMEGPALLFDLEPNQIELISSGLFGPPELCGGNVRTGKGLSLSIGNVEILGFYPGYLYQKYGYVEHCEIVIRKIASLLNSTLLVTDAPACVELSLSRNQKGDILLFMISSVGFNGKSFYEPPEIGDFMIRIQIQDKPLINKIFPIAGKFIYGTFINNDEGYIDIQVSKLKDFGVIVLEAQDVKAD